MPIMHAKPAAVFALAAALSFTGGVIAHAQSDDLYTRSIAVSTHGMDLNAPSDRTRLAHRIEIAARRVCDRYDGVASALSGAYAACHDQAVADANAQLHVMIARRFGTTMVAESAAPAH